jgi:hypothetical protein
MSGTFNLMLASFGGSSQGLIAAISNSNGSSVTNPRIAIRNDQLNLALTSLSASSEQQFTVLRLDLGLSAITWQTSLTNPPEQAPSGSIKLDSAGNVIAAGAFTVSSGATPNAFVAKFNSSGALQWQRRISGNSSFYSVAIDASDNIYCAGVGRFVSADRDDAYLAKFDSTGALTYQRTIGNTASGVTEYVNRTAVVGIYFYLAILYKGASVQYEAQSFLADPATGAKVGAVNFRTSNGSDSLFYQGLVAGETSTTYYQLFYAPATSEQTLVKEVIGSGTVYRQSLFAANLVPTDMCMDPSGTHVYTCGYLSGTLQLAKFAASTGALVWQRSLSAPTVTITNEAEISVDSLDNIYVNFKQEVSGSPTKSMILKMPGSGAGVGNSAVIDGKTYTYAATTFFSGAANAVLAASNADVDSAATQTVVTTTYASVTPTLAITSQAF